MLYADDTICVSTEAKQINRRLAAIEKHGGRYGLKLNKDKCKINFTVKLRFACPLTFALVAPASQKYLQTELFVHNLTKYNDMSL